MKLLSKILLLSSGIALLGLGACKKSYLDRYPSNEVPLSDAFKTTAGCKAALEGLHSLMYRATDDEAFGQKSIDLMNDLMGEDMPMHDQGSGWFVGYANYTDPRSGAGYIWSYYYSFILNCNQILAHLDAAVGPQSEKDNIKGQTYFYLAFAYYNLSIYYQHTYYADPSAPCVPIYHEVTQTGNPRASVQDVYNEITSDLDQALNLLDPANGAPNRANKSEINIDVVRGLYARVALVMHKWTLADQMAGEARQNYPYMSATDLLSGFNNWQNSAWIWGSHLNEEQTNNVWSFISQMDVDAGGYAAIGGQKLINTTLYNSTANIGDSVDIRRNWWYGDTEGDHFKYCQKKFRVLTPGSFSLDVCYMRAAEMGFIQAEAKAQNGDIAGAQETLQDIMKIRNPKYDASSFTTASGLLREIWHERRVELWGEGFRYSDLQRCAGFPAGSIGYNAATGNDGFRNRLFYQALHREYSGGDQTVYGSALTYTDALDNKFLFRLPGSEINYNPNMKGQQNP